MAVLGNMPGRPRMHTSAGRIIAAACSVVNTTWSEILAVAVAELHWLRTFFGWTVILPKFFLVLARLQKRSACIWGNDRDPLVAKFHIPASHLWTARRQDSDPRFLQSFPLAEDLLHGQDKICDAPNSHPCGQSCCRQPSFTQLPLKKEHQPMHNNGYK